MMKENYNYKIYTDGAYAFDKRTGGWAYLILDENDNELFAHCGKEINTTNNKMELVSVINALDWYNNLNFKGSVIVYSDSSYVVNAFLDEWIEKWRNNGWVNSQKKPVVSKELWEKLELLVQKTQTTFKHVKSGSNEYNKKVDKLSSNIARQ